MYLCRGHIDLICVCVVDVRIIVSLVCGHFLTCVHVSWTNILGCFSLRVHFTMISRKCQIKYSRFRVNFKLFCMAWFMSWYSNFRRFPNISGYFRRFSLHDGIGGIADRPGAGVNPKNTAKIKSDFLQLPNFTTVFKNGPYIYICLCRHKSVL